MAAALTSYYKRIIQRQIQSGKFSSEDEVLRHSLRVLDSVERRAGPAGVSFGNARKLETLLLEGLDSGAAAPMTQRRKQRIYARLKNR